MNRLLALVLAVIATGCVATVDTGNKQGAEPDASDDAVIDAAIDAPPDASFVTACETAGYTAQANLTSLYRRGASATWSAAEAACVADVPGATHLVVLSSSAEVDFVKTTLGWVGLSDQATEGTFVNVTNEANDLRPFANGQPDNGGGDENCVQMKTTAGLDDDQCNKKHAFQCECDGVAATP
ncbi:MAG: C-type lectin domain-containing protein [Kofleriaceae bacterium]